MNNIDKSFEWLLNQLVKGNTIENIEKGIHHMEFESVKEWKSKYGYKFHIYSNDHFINNKPHFHLTKTSENIDFRIFFNGDIYDEKEDKVMDKNVNKAIRYFLENENNQDILIEMWNNKNPDYLYLP